MKKYPIRISISAFKVNSKKVLDELNKTGNPILLTRHGVAIATLSPPPCVNKRDSWLGSFKDSAKIVGDILSPLSESLEWEVLSETD